MKRTLLIVDDVKTNREILCKILCDEYNLICASNGREAISAMRSEFKQISAVLLDLGMPVMDGFEVLDIMRGDSLLSLLPVIVTTGLSDSEERALSLGAKDYVSKPYKPTIIKQRIRNTIKLRETSATVNALQKDRLTGLLSREAFFEKVAEAVSKKEAGHYIMACFDIDKFKVINDQYGAEKGDEVLCHVASVFKKGFESHGGFCCRVSGDNFAVLYPAAFKNDKAIAQIRKEGSSVSWLVSPLTFSIGRYLVTDPTMSPSAMFDRASIAADLIKGRYDTKICEYDESMRARLIHEQEIVNEMEGALEKGQFEVWYQPQYNHSSGALVGSEALVRWRHPEKGLIPPGEFIPVFEQNGFIYSLDKFVWEQVCIFLRGELDIENLPLPVSVNISRHDIFCSDIVENITGLIKKYDIPVSLLRLEITESAFAESAGRIIDVAKELVKLGFTLEIDDFGSGYSSLNTLKNVPAQVVKLDMKFLEDDEGSQRSGNIVESVVRMAKWLGMSVIAEGVERKQQADFLRSIGCNYIQGYYYAKPMPQSDYKALLYGAEKENKLVTMETVENLDNNKFWNQDSMDTLIFNSYVGAACIFEFHDGKIEILRATEKYAQIIGCAGLTIEKALKINWSEHLDESSMKRAIVNLETSAAQKKEVSGEYIFLDLPGCPHETYLRSSFRVIATAGKRYLVYCTNENITAQRQAEHREHRLTEQLQAIMDNVHCGITAVIPDGKTVCYLLTNSKYYALLGYTKKQYEDEVGKNAYITVFPDDVGRIAETVQRAYKTGGTATIEYRALRRDKSIIWLRSNISETNFDGISEPVQLTTYVDITENKKAEQELLETSSQLKNMMDDMPGGFVRLRIFEDGTIKPIFFNDGFYRITGMNYDELMKIYGENALAGVHPDDVNIVKDAISKMFENGEAKSARYRLVLKNGDYTWLSIFGRITTDEDGCKYMNIYYSDANEQVNEEQRQKELLDNLPYGAALYSLDGTKLRSVHINKRYWELVGRNPADYEDSGAFIDDVHPDDISLITFELRTAINEKRDFNCDARVLDGENHYKSFHILGRIVPAGNDRYSIYAVYTPIVREEHSFQEMLPIALGAMMSAQTDYSFVKDKDLHYVCCSSPVAKMMGKTSESEIIGKSDYDIFDKELADRFRKDDRKVMETGISIIDGIDKLPPVNGNDCFACTSKFPLKDSEGNIIGIYGIGRDITEVRALRSQFGFLTNSIPGGIATFEFAGGKLHITYFNEGFCRLFEIDREKYIKLSAKDPFVGIVKEDMPEILEQLDSLVRRNSQIDCVYRVRLSYNKCKWINMKASSVEWSSERIVFNAVLLDITQRQEAMEQLRISEEENRLAMQHTGSTVCRYDVATHSIAVPEKTREKYPLKEKIENIPFSSIECGDISPDTAEAYKAFFEGINSGSTSGIVTYQRKSYHGWRWLKAHYSTIFSSSGKPVSAVISFNDIIEQLEKDAAYQRWQQSLQNKDPDSYSLFRCSVSRKTNFEFKEGSLLNIGFRPGEALFKEHTEEYASQFILEDDRESFCAFLDSDTLLANYYQGKRVLIIEYRERIGIGVSRWLRLTVDMVAHPRSGEVEAYLLFENIDVKKREELATRELAESDSLTGVMNRMIFEAQVNRLLKSSPANENNILMMLDIDGFKQVNDSFGHLAGDEALIDIAAALRSVLRSGDLVGRLGGDEFVIFLTNIPNDVVAANKARQICALTRKSFSVEVEISGSVGIAVAPRDGDDFETLYKKVDAALYHVKSAGKDNFAFYHSGMTEERLELKKEISAGGFHSEKNKRRILIVDDSNIDHALLSNIFAADFNIEKAKDGGSALVRLRHYGASISVVLLDIIMPGMDGFAVLRKMQESAELRNIPVIVVSGDESREANLRAIRAGAVDYVSKPVDPDILRIRVLSAISRAENERLRAKNSYLECQNSEVLRYKTVLERSGTVVIEHDWVGNNFTYDPKISSHIAGVYDDRKLWHILLSDFVTDTQTVKKMQELVQKIAADRRESDDVIFVQLRTPSKTVHWFKMGVYKVINEFGLTGKIYLTFNDFGNYVPAEQLQIKSDNINNLP